MILSLMHHHLPESDHGAKTRRELEWGICTAIWKPVIWATLYLEILTSSGNDLTPGFRFRADMLSI